MHSLDSLAPSWSGQDQDDALRSSDDFKGKWLLLYFYPKDDTPGCTKEACSFRDEYARFANRAAIIGVSGDNVESHKKFIEKYSLPFSLIADPGKAIIAAFGADGIQFPKRTTFLIDPEGIIQKIYSGFDIPSHANTIDSDLTTFGA